MISGEGYVTQHLLRTYHENINKTLVHFNHVNKQGHPNFQLEPVWRAGNGVDKKNPHPYPSKSTSKTTTVTAERRVRHSERHFGLVKARLLHFTMFIPSLPLEEGTQRSAHRRIQIWAWNECVGFDTHACEITVILETHAGFFFCLCELIIDFVLRSKALKPARLISSPGVISPLLPS